MRIKIPSKRGDSGYFLSIRNLFSQYDGIEKLETNEMTGSVLFLHKLEMEVIIRHAEANKLFRLAETPDSSPLNSTVLSNRITASFNTLNKRLKNFTANEMDIPGIATVTLFGLGMYQISRGRFGAIPWYTALWYMLNIHLKGQSNNPLPEKHPLKRAPKRKRSL
ncbi:MAG: hypothetical protein MRJ65_01515 [Candidatus Brocadiaceae bacterium]|nr:hypothetical protein [Candidatus Brocadiaceae bacterium]